MNEPIHPKPLAITSPTNFHALGNYFGMSVIGAAYFFNPRIQAIDEFLGPRAGAVIMCGMMLCGIFSLMVVLLVHKRRDPTKLLILETCVLSVLTVILGILIVGILLKYGIGTAMVTSLLLASLAFGCAGRGVQAFVELRRLNKAKRRPLVTIEVPADPEQG